MTEQQQWYGELTMDNRKRQQGFSLIEIMVVVVILGILSSYVVLNIMDKPDQARQVAAKNDIRTIMSALKLYKLDSMLVRAAEAQERELENWVKTFTAILEPLLIIGMGVMVLLIVLAIMMPIFEMNQLVK